MHASARGIPESQVRVPLMHSRVQSSKACSSNDVSRGTSNLSGKELRLVNEENRIKFFSECVCVVIHERVLSGL